MSSSQNVEEHGLYSHAAAQAVLPPLIVPTGKRRAYALAGPFKMSYPIRERVARPQRVGVSTPYVETPLRKRGTRKTGVASSHEHETVPLPNGDDFKRLYMGACGHQSEAVDSMLAISISRHPKRQVERSADVQDLLEPFIASEDDRRYGFFERPVDHASYDDEDFWSTSTEPSCRPTAVSADDFLFNSTMSSNKMSKSLTCIQQATLPAFDDVTAQSSESVEVLELCPGCGRDFCDPFDRSDIPSDLWYQKHFSADMQDYLFRAYNPDHYQREDVVRLREAYYRRRMSNFSSYIPLPAGVESGCLDASNFNFGAVADIIRSILEGDLPPDALSWYVGQHVIDNDSITAQVVDENGVFASVSSAWRSLSKTASDFTSTVTGFKQITEFLNNMLSTIKCWSMHIAKACVPLAIGTIVLLLTYYGFGLSKLKAAAAGAVAALISGVVSHFVMSTQGSAIGMISEGLTPIFEWVCSFFSDDGDDEKIDAIESLPTDYVVAYNLAHWPNASDMLGQEVPATSARSLTKALIDYTFPPSELEVIAKKGFRPYNYWILSPTQEVDYKAAVDYYRCRGQEYLSTMAHSYLYWTQDQVHVLDGVQWICGATGPLIPCDKNSPWWNDSALPRPSEVKNPWFPDERIPSSKLKASFRFPANTYVDAQSATVFEKICGAFADVVGIVNDMMFPMKASSWLLAFNMVKTVGQALRWMFDFLPFTIQYYVYQVSPSLASAVFLRSSDFFSWLQQTKVMEQQLKSPTLFLLSEARTLVQAGEKIWRGVFDQARHLYIKKELDSFAKKVQDAGFVFDYSKQGKVPYVIWLFGDPGIGKSEFNTAVASVMSGIVSESRSPKEAIIFQPGGDTKFRYERITKEHKVLFINDFFLGDKDRNTDAITEFCHMVESKPFVPPQAVAELKGTQVSFDAIVVGANYGYLSAGVQGAHSHGPFHRRRNVVLRASLNPTFFSTWRVKLFNPTDGSRPFEHIVFPDDPGVRSRFIEAVSAACNKHSTAWSVGDDEERAALSHQLSRYCHLTLRNCVVVPTNEYDRCERGEVYASHFEPFGADFSPMKFLKNLRGAYQDHVAQHKTVACNREDIYDEIFDDETPLPESVDDTEQVRTWVSAIKAVTAFGGIIAGVVGIGVLLRKMYSIGTEVNPQYDRGGRNAGTLRHRRNRFTNVAAEAAMPQEFVDNLTDNTVRVRCGPRTMHGFLINANHLLLNTHFLMENGRLMPENTEFLMDVYDDDGTRVEYSFRFQRSCLTLLGRPNTKEVPEDAVSDISVYRLSKYIRGIRDVRSRFVTKAELESTPDDIPIVRIETGNLITGWFKAQLGVGGYNNFPNVYSYFGRYSAQCGSGSCGAPLALTTHGKDVVIGIHCGDTKSLQANGVYLPVFREKLDSFNPVLEVNAQCEVLEGIECANDAAEFIDFQKESPANLKLIAVLPKNIPCNMRSAMRKTPFFEIFGAARTVPAVLTPQMLYKVEKRFGQRYKAIPRDLLEYGYQCARLEFLRQSHVPRRRMTRKEALDGLYLNTSPGLPWTREGKTRKDLFIQEPDGSIHPQFSVSTRINKILQRWENGESPPLPVQAALKDECLKFIDTPEGRIVKDTRSFEICGVDYVVAYRELFGNFHDHLTAMHTKSACSIGIDPLSIEWDDMMRHLLSIFATGEPVRFVDSDYKGFETVVSQELLHYYALLAAEFCDSPALPFVAACNSATNRYTYMNKLVVGNMHGMPSGVPLTAHANTVVNFILHAAAFKALAKCKVTEEDFLTQVRVKMLGDDNIQAVRPMAAEFYNFKTLHAWFRDICAITITPTNKEPDPKKFQEFTTLEDLSYLKKQFRISKRFGTWMPIVNWPVFKDSINYTTDITPPGLLNLANSFLRHIFFFGNVEHDVAIDPSWPTFDWVRRTLLPYFDPDSRLRLVTYDQLASDFGNLVAHVDYQQLSSEFMTGVTAQGNVQTSVPQETESATGGATIIKIGTVNGASQDATTRNEFSYGGGRSGLGGLLPGGRGKWSMLGGFADAVGAASETGSSVSAGSGSSPRKDSRFISPRSIDTSQIGMDSMSWAGGDRAPSSGRLGGRPWYNPRTDDKNWDQPNHQAVAVPTYQGVIGRGTCDGPSFANYLQDIAGITTGPSPDLFGTCIDEADIAFLTRKWGFLATYNWNDASAAGTALGAWMMSPDFWYWSVNAVGGVATRVPADTQVSLAPFSFAASQFFYWQGGLEWKIQVIAPQQMSGRLVIGLYYNHNVTPAYNYALSGPHFIFDFNSAEREFIFRTDPITVLEWMQHPWAHVNSQYRDERYSHGTIVVYVGSKIAEPSGFTNSVTLNLWGRAGPDFEVLSYAPPMGLATTPFEPDLSVTAQAFVGNQSFDSDKVVAGRKPKSLRTTNSSAKISTEVLANMPLQKAVYTVSASNTSGSNIFRLALPDDFLGGQVGGANALGQFWRGDLEVRLLNQATGWQAGMLIMAYMPFSNTGEVQSLQQVSALDHVLLDLSLTRSASLVIPYRNIINFWKIGYEYTNRIGTLACMVLNTPVFQSGGSTSLDVALEFRWTNHEVLVPVGRPGPFLEELPEYLDVTAQSGVTEQPVATTSKQSDEAVPNTAGPAGVFTIRSRRTVHNWCNIWRKPLPIFNVVSPIGDGVLVMLPADATLMDHTGINNTGLIASLFALYKGDFVFDINIASPPGSCNAYIWSQVTPDSMIFGYSDINRNTWLWDAITSVIGGGLMTPGAPSHIMLPCPGQTRVSVPFFSHYVSAAVPQSQSGTNTASIAKNNSYLFIFLDNVASPGDTDFALGIQVLTQPGDATRVGCFSGIPPMWTGVDSTGNSLPGFFLNPITRKPKKPVGVPTRMNPPIRMTRGGKTVHVYLPFGVPNQLQNGSK